jgi:hypothetical protein
LTLQNDFKNSLCEVISLLNECGTHKSVKAGFWPWLAKGTPLRGRATPKHTPGLGREREFFIDNLLVHINFIIEMN